MGRGGKSSKHERAEEQEVEESPDNDLAWSDDEESNDSSYSASTATIRDGVEILKLLADYDYDVKGKLADGSMTFLFRSKNREARGANLEQLDGRVEDLKRYVPDDQLLRNEYKGRAPAPPAYNEPLIRDDRSVKSKKRSSRHNGIAGWMRT